MFHDPHSRIGELILLMLLIAGVLISKGKRK
jgi:hypothetical protein